MGFPLGFALEKSLRAAFKDNSSRVKTGTCNIFPFISPMTRHLYIWIFSPAVEYTSLEDAVAVAEYVLEKGLAGVMTWDVNRDCRYILYPNWDERRDIWSNITLGLKEFPRAKPKGIPEGEGVYLTVYPELSPNTDIILFYQS